MKFKLIVPLSMLIPISSLAQMTAPRVYITDNKSWFISGTAAQSDGNGGAVMSGGSISDNMPLIQHFVKECPGVVVSQNKDAADYVVLFEGNHAARAANGSFGLVGLIVNLSAKYEQIAVFRGNGDILFTGNTRHLKNAVKDACNAVISAPMVAHVAPAPREAPPTQTIVVRVESATPAAATVATAQLVTPIVAPAPAPTVAPVVPASPALATTASSVAAPAEPALGDVARQYRTKKAKQPITVSEQAPTPAQPNQQ